MSELKLKELEEKAKVRRARTEAKAVVLVNELLTNHVEFKKMPHAYADCLCKLYVFAFYEGAKDVLDDIEARI